MKKTAAVLVALSISAGAACGQSQVVVFGKIDQAVGKPVGTANRQVLDTAGSRLAFRGLEDLGGGSSAIFAFEHRFVPDSGAGATSSVFWDGFSYVGLRNKTWGTVTVGRQYTSTFLTVQNAIDPFAGETVAALRTIYMGGAYGTSDPPAGAPNTWAGAPAAAGPSKGRVADAIKYGNAFGDVIVSADIAETPQGGVDRPWSAAVAYAKGPLWLGAGYEDAQGRWDRTLNVAVRYDFGSVALSGGFTDGRINLAVDNRLRAWLLGAVVPLGTGEIKLGHAASKVAGVARNGRTGLGYHHHLSKRTKIYVDVAHEGEGLAANRKGYDLGLQHQF